MKITAIESQKKALETTLYTPTEPKDCDSIPQSELILKNIDKQNHCINTIVQEYVRPSPSDVLFPVTFG